MSTSIVARGLGKRFGSFQAVSNVSFEVNTGEIFGYLGANGAGKSTTIRMLCGLLKPTDGSAQVAGFSVATQAQKVRARIGYMSQRFSLYPELRVQENLAFFGGAYGLDGASLAHRIDEILELVGLHGHGAELTAALPGGMRQRVALAGALLHKPSIVFLDEPTAGVDPRARRRFWSIIRQLAEEGVSIFVTTHYMDEAEYCARVGLMVAGRLAALDAPAALKATYVPGRIWSIRGLKRPDAEVRGILEGVAGVLDVATMGAGVRVRVHDDNASFASRLTQLLPGCQVEAAEASLEDVFLAVVDAETMREGNRTAFGGGA